jgi:hypothetical protein
MDARQRKAYLEDRDFHCLLKAMSLRQSLEGLALNTAMILSHTSVLSCRASAFKVPGSGCEVEELAPSAASVCLAIPILSLVSPADLYTCQAS